MADARPTDRPVPSLSPRLAAIAAHVPPGARLADIGTDHAALPVVLARMRHVVAAVAVDLRPGAVALANRMVVRHGVGDRVAVRRGDGLAALREGEADVVVISGLGGSTIVRILAAEPTTLDTVGRLIVAPQSETWRVRRWLMTNGWSIVAEVLLRDGAQDYEILVTERGDPRAAYRWSGRPSQLRTASLLWLGPVLARAAEAHWQDRWRRAADDREALADRTAANGSTRAIRAAGRHRRWAARTRSAVDAAKGAAERATEGSQSGSPTAPTGLRTSGDRAAVHA